MKLQCKTRQISRWVSRRRRTSDWTATASLEETTNESTLLLPQVRYILCIRQKYLCYLRRRKGAKLTTRSVRFFISLWRTMTNERYRPKKKEKPPLDEEILKRVLERLQEFRIASEP